MPAASSRGTKKRNPAGPRTARGNAEEADA